LRGFVGADTPLIETRDLTVKYFGRIGGVENLSLSVRSGETIALVGTNGSGKTSALRAIAGFLPREPAKITSGRVFFEGQDITGKGPRDVAHLGVAMIPERDKVFVELTPMEHFRLVAGNKKRPDFDDAVVKVLDLFPNLRDHLHRPAGYFSGGQRQMLAFATAVLRGPRVMLVDEFTQGLAPTAISDLAETVRNIRATGMTFVLVEQNVALARSLADRLYVLDAGRLVASGTQAELSLAAVARTYLGLGEVRV
jgi:ABC-type branched-subunit amino acid transport system ATPase component